VMGLSPIEMNADAIGLAMATESFAARFFGQNSVPKGYFKHPNVMGADGIKNFKDEMRDMHSGLDNAHNFAVLEEGLEWVSIGIKPEEAQFLEGRKFQIPEIARIYELPNHKLNDLERATFGNIEEQNIDFVTDSIQPEVCVWEGGLNSQLLSEAEQKTHWIGFVMEALLRGRTLERYQAYAVGRQWGWLSKNDVREKENMNLLSPEIGDDYLDPLNMVKSGEKPPQNEPPQDQNEPQDPPPKDEKPAQEPPKKRDLKRERAVGITIFSDVLTRMTSKERLFLTRAQEKMGKTGDKEAFKASVGEFYRENETVFATSLKPAFEALALLLGENRDAENDAKSYSKSYCDSACTEVLVGLSANGGIEALVTRWASDKAQSGACADGR
jgi:hypothetical protein